MKVVSLLLVFVASACLATAQEASPKALKAATIDANELITKYYKADDKLSKLTAERDKYVEERKQQTKVIQEVETKLRGIIAKLRSKDTQEQERKALQGEYDDLVNQHRALVRDVQESDQSTVAEIKRKLADETRILLDEINQVVAEYAKQNGYSWVIETSGSSNTQISPLVYARNTTDITKEVLAVLNKDAPAKKESEDSEESE